MVGVAVVGQHAGARDDEQGVLVRGAAVGACVGGVVDELHLEELEVLHVQVEALELEFLAVVAACVGVAREEILECRDVLLH